MDENTPFAKQSREKEQDNDNGHNNPLASKDE